MSMPSKRDGSLVYVSVSVPQTETIPLPFLPNHDLRLHPFGKLPEGFVVEGVLL